ncbi:hypothetical protein EGR_11288 [Echinococcus granulosus]|uniref:Uncharacterized protein n=1 Tax=Echinococcus granulosus TaxID=6210 RepID=W6U072_ECHGR|nr:hypothetical protein EGR_11288 [Echinococcus granulosus]EUB53861.1 hypothetical protein EGR_11288 [Echinococcus granulosus]
MFTFTGSYAGSATTPTKRDPINTIYGALEYFLDECYFCSNYYPNISNKTFYLANKESWLPTFHALKYAQLFGPSNKRGYTLHTPLVCYHEFISRIAYTIGPAFVKQSVITIILHHFTTDGKHASLQSPLNSINYAKKQATNYNCFTISIIPKSVF